MDDESSKWKPTSKSLTDQDGTVLSGSLEKQGAQVFDDNLVVSFTGGPWRLQKKRKQIKSWSSGALRQEGYLLSRRDQVVGGEGKMAGALRRSALMERSVSPERSGGAIRKSGALRQCVITTRGKE